MSGLVLVLLGIWAGIAPFVGPYFGYGYAPGRTLTLTSGRFYLSVLPGVVVLAAGLVVLITRSRWLGGCCAVVAALAGFWLVAGATVVRLLPASLALHSATPGAPVSQVSSKELSTTLTFYTLAGALIVFFAALALGRFSLTAYKDYARFGTDLADPGAGALAYSGYQPGQGQDVQTYSLTPPQYSPDQSQYPASQFPASQFPSDQFPPQYPSPFPPDQYAATEAGQTGYADSGGQPTASQDPPAQDQSASTATPTSKPPWEAD
ncbi:MAG TPA: hypothetical protein VNF47_12345 [Streptosporangiaceae bacterium]|nr:hypothetical protein [Streptosporangiaceae bacterium]